jgi:hypothetical protein
MFLTREETDLLTTEQCEQHLVKLTKKYNLDKPLHLMWNEVWPDLDEIVNTLLYLEDQLRYLQQSEIMTRVNTARWADKKAAE